MSKPTLSVQNAPDVETVSPNTASSKEIGLVKAEVNLHQDAIARFSPPKSELNTAGWSPTLQNVLEQPPAAFPQQLLIGGMIFSLALAAWTWLGKIEEVGHARGQLEPQGDTYKIQPIDAGKLWQINVKEGDFVRAGQVLFELDSQIANNEVERLNHKIADYREQIEQKQALIEKLWQEAQIKTKFSQANLRVQKALIDAAIAKAANSRELLAQIQIEKEASQERFSSLSSLTAISQEHLKQLQQDVAAHRERVNRLRQLVDDGAISQEYLFQAEQGLRDRQAAISQAQLQEGANTGDRLFDAQQKWRDRISAITQQQGELEQSLAQIQSLQAQLDQKQAEAHINKLAIQQRIGQLETEKTQLQAVIVETQNLLNSARKKLIQRFLSAPVDGIVSSLDIHHQGEVVQPGRTLAEIAPKTAPLVLSANLPNREAGFIKLGMPVQVKIDAFPYQDYGAIAGKVISISPDTKQDKQQGAVYKVEVALDHNFIIAKGQTIPFKAGQTATADIVIRRRRIAEVLLDPISNTNLK
jgi:HlyD family secretion protein